MPSKRFNKLPKNTKSLKSELIEKLLPEIKKNWTTKFNESVDFNYLVFLAVASSFIFSFLTVKFFLDYINKFSMNAFVIYRILIALVLFYIIY